MVEQIESTDIQTTKKEIKEKETLDQILQSKISDPNTLQKAKSIFEEVQKSFQTSINDYIKELDIKQINYIINKEPEPIKYLIEDIDITIGLITIDITKDKVIETKDKVIETKDKIIETKDKVIETKDKVIETKDTIENQNTLLEARTAATESYNNLDQKYKQPTTESEQQQINTIKNSFTKETEDILTTQNLDINIYAKFIFTQQKYEKELRKEGNTDFLDKLNEVNRLVKYTTSFSETSNPNKTDNIIENNKNLQTYIKKSSDLQNITIPLDKKLSYNDEEFELYSKFIPDQKTKKIIESNKENIQKYAKNLETKKPNNDENMANIYQTYTKEISQIKNALTTDTQNMIQKRVVGSCISGLASYFDSSTIEKDTNFADDFDINTQNGFTIQDDTLNIKGNIKGNEIGFSYNMIEDQNSNLESDDSLHYNKVSNNFTLGTKKGAKNNLGIKLPTIKYLTQVAQNFSQDNFQKTIESSENIQSFQKEFKQKLSQELAKEFGQKTIVESRVKRDIQKNITTQTLQNSFIPKEITTKINEKENVNITDKTTHAIFSIRDTTTENMRSDELEKFNKLIIVFNDTIKTVKNNNALEKNRKQLCANIYEEQKKETNNRGTNILGFFQKISKNNRINIQDFENIITILQKDEETIGENIQKFSPEFQTAQDQEDADQLITQIT